MPARMRSVGKNVCSLYEIDVEQFAAVFFRPGDRHYHAQNAPRMLYQKMFLEWNSLWMTLDKALVL